MNLKSLKVFCDIVARRSFSRAAEDNGISQSGASQVVSHLEQHLGVQLIRRSKRPLVPTAEGQVFFDGCRGIVARYEALEDEVRALHAEVAGQVRVAAIYSVGLHHMSRSLKQFMSHYPKANVRLEYLHPQRVLETVENGQADIGLVSYPRSTRAIQAEPWRDEPMVLVCAPGHAFTDRLRIEPSELDGCPLVGFDPDLVIRHEIDRALAAEGVEPRVVMEFDNIETIKRAVEIDAGVAILPEPTVSRELAAGMLVAVPLAVGEAFVRPLGIIHARGKPLAATTKRFVDLLRSCPPDGDMPTEPPAEPEGSHDVNDMNDTNDTNDTKPRRHAEPVLTEATQ